MDTGSTGVHVILRTDPRATIIYWANATDSAKNYIDFVDVLDVRFGKYARPPQKVGLRNRAILNIFN